MPSHKPELATLSITRLHELTGFARETITKRLEGKLEPARRDGRTIYYYPRAALPLLYLLEERLDASQERARLDRARSIAQEMKNALDRKELVSATAVVELWSRRIVMVKTRLRALPAQAAARIPGVTTQITARLIDLVERVLVGLADDADTGDDPDRSRESVAPRS